MKDLLAIIEWATSHKYAVSISEPDTDDYAYSTTTKVTVIVEVPGPDYGSKVHETITALNLMQTECVVYTEETEIFGRHDNELFTQVIAHVVLEKIKHY